MDGSVLGLFLSPMAPMAVTFFPDDFCFLPQLSCYQQDEIYQDSTEQH